MLIQWEPLTMHKKTERFKFSEKSFFHTILRFRKPEKKTKGTCSSEKTLLIVEMTRVLQNRIFHGSFTNAIGQSIF